jgi:hypothetical protein
VALAKEALGMVRADVSGYWQTRLSAVQDEDEAQFVARVPKLSDPARMFAAQVLKTNRGRLLDECW